MKADEPLYLDETKVLETRMLKMYHPVKKRSGKSGGSACDQCGQPAYFHEHEPAKVKMAQEILKQYKHIKWFTILAGIYLLHAVIDLLEFFFL